MGADGGSANLLFMPGGGSRCPPTPDSVSARLHFLRMNGRETYKSAVQAMYTAAREALRRCELEISQIKCIIPHQANRRIIDAVGQRLGAKPGQMFVNLERYGNTSAASVAIALDEAVAAGKIQRGDLVLMIVFGAGLHLPVLIHIQCSDQTRQDQVRVGAGRVRQHDLRFDLVHLIALCLTLTG